MNIEAGGAEIREINGKMMIVHEVKTDDSLPRLSIMYNVSVPVLKRVNGLGSDMIYHKPELFIPIQDGVTVTARAKVDLAKAEADEKLRREAAIRMMNEYIGEVLGERQKDHSAEATFYCEENDYQYRKAKVQFDADRAFEQD